MATIQNDWNAAVESAAIHDAGVNVIGNVNANAIRAAADLRGDIQAQMQSRVRWTESVQRMIENGIKAFVEVGNDSVLIGLIRRIDSSVDRMPMGNPVDFAALDS